jgi:hypothetical protein
MVSMCRALERIKQEPFAILGRDAVQSVCEQMNHVWRVGGPLDPAHTMKLFVQQIAAGNISCAAVRHLSDRDFTAEAYCQARQRLPLKLVAELSARVGRAVQGESQRDRCPRWHGHAVRIVDGSSFSMPDTPELAEHFGQPVQQKAGCGFPVAHLLVLFDWQSGLLAEPVLSPLYTTDLKHTARMHEQMQAGDVLLGDDSFSSWAHFALAQRAGVHLLTPSHHTRIVSFVPHRPHTSARRHAPGQPRSRWIKSLGWQDQRVEWFKPADCPPWMSQADYDALPESIEVREIRRTLKRKGFRPIPVTLVTTLLEPQQYPADELVHLRGQRWEVETDLRHLKTTMGMDVLHCKSVDGVTKELNVFVLVYNLVRAIMLQAAHRQQVPIDRISFADALAWLRHANSQTLPRLLRNPHRPNRVEPRVLKRRPKAYPPMRQPRDELRNALQSNNKAA